MFSCFMNPLRAAWLTTAIVISGLAALPSTALAQTDPGRIHFQAGASDYESGDYEHALGEFQRAYELSERKQLFYNIALSYQQLGDLEHAVEFLGRYLNEVEDIPNRATLERRQANLQRRLEAQSAQAEQAAAAEQAAEQAAAAHAAAAQAAADQNSQSATDAMTDSTGDAADSQAATRDATATTPSTASDEGGGANVPAIVSFVGGGVGVAMAVAFGVMALSERDKVTQNGCTRTSPCAEVSTTMDTYAHLSDVGTGLAVVGVGLGLVFLLTADDEERDPSQARIHVAPFAGPNAAGLAAQGSF